MGTMCEMEIVSNAGHKREMWDSENADEVASARATFESLTKKGYKASRVKKNGEKGEPMTTFDPHAEAMLITGPITGG